MTKTKIPCLAVRALDTGGRLVRPGERVRLLEAAIEILEPKGVVARLDMPAQRLPEWLKERIARLYLRGKELDVPLEDAVRIVVKRLDEAETLEAVPRRVTAKDLAAWTS